MANEVIQGRNELLATMRQLGNSRKIKNACTRASRKAMNIVRDEAKKNAKRLGSVEHS